MSARVLIGKVRLDVTTAGVKVVARILRDAGFEVIYTGLFQTADTIAAAAVDDDVDVVGLSMLSGAHMTLAPLVVDKLRERGVDIPVVVGGIVPKNDVDKLRRLASPRSSLRGRAPMTWWRLCRLPSRDRLPASRRADVADDAGRRSRRGPRAPALRIGGLAVRP